MSSRFDGPKVERENKSVVIDGGEEKHENLIESFSISQSYLNKFFNSSKQ